MTNVTPSQRRILQIWFEDIYDRKDRFDFSIQFVRLLAGDKPATEIQQTDWDHPRTPFDSEEDVLDFTEGMGLCHRQQKKGRSYTISNSSWRLDLLPTVARTYPKKALHKRLGTVYGYPQEDIEWFIRDEDRIEPRDRVDNGDFTPEEMAFVKFLAYVNDNSIEGYERAIENGKRVRELLSDVADEWDLPIIDQIAEDHYQLSVDVYSGKREYFPGEHIGFKMVCKNPALD